MDRSGRSWDGDRLQPGQGRQHRSAGVGHFHHHDPAAVGAGVGAESALVCGKVAMGAAFLWPEFRSMIDPSSCGVCQIHDALASSGFTQAPIAGAAGPGDLAIGRFGPWLLRHHPLPAPLVGWLLLDSLRHVGGPADFDATEAAAFGVLLQRSSALVRELSGCQRVYAVAFGEGARHFHLHLIPRHGSDPATESWRVADLYRAVSAGERPAAEPDSVLQLVQRARQASGGWQL